MPTTLRLRLRRRRELPPARRARAEAAGTAAVVTLAAAALGGFDALLAARNRAGTDAALTMATLDPWVGVGPWYGFARACGLTALCCAWLATVASLSPVRLRRLPAIAGAHRAAGLALLALAAAHAAVPYLAIDPPLGGWATALVPWAQPWGGAATEWQTAGVVALYLGALTGPSMYLLRRRWGLWRQLHRGAAVAYVLLVGHAFFLGSDFLVRGWPRVVLLGAQVPVLLGVAGRLVGADARPRGAGPGGGRSHGRGTARRLAAALTFAAAVAVAVVTVTVAVGAVAPGRPTAAATPPPTQGGGRAVDRVTARTASARQAQAAG